MSIEVTFVFISIMAIITLFCFTVMALHKTEQKLAIMIKETRRVDVICSSALSNKSIRKIEQVFNQRSEEVQSIISGRGK